MRRNWLTISFPDWLTINWREEDAHNEDFLLVVFVRLDTKCFNPPQADHDLYSTKVRDCNVAIQIKLLQLPAKKTDAFAGYFFSRYYATCRLVFSVLEVEMPALVEILHFFLCFFSEYHLISYWSTSITHPWRFFRLTFIHDFKPEGNWKQCLWKVWVQTEFVMEQRVSCEWTHGAPRLRFRIIYRILAKKPVLEFKSPDKNFPDENLSSWS